jgi:serine/threonine-protein kinase PknG
MPTLRPTSLRTRPLPRRDSGRTDSGRSSRRTSSTRLGLGLVDLPPVPTGDPAQAVMAVAEVPEDKRFCSHCDNAVGRSRGDKPGRTEGFCPHCRTHYSFTPKLAAGDVVAQQYEVLGALAHGGLGWIYLARDRAVSDRWVVLKGLLDAASEDAALASVAEQRYLAALDHPNIVRIYNFVTHEGAGYIVMEYVGGKSLKTILKERRDAHGGAIEPLPVDEAMAYVLGVLPALGYLHDTGLLYCDMKPDNVVLAGDSLKVIDLGGVRRIDDLDAAIYGTVGYQAPEVPDTGPTVASDLFTIGRTLAVLTLDFKGYQTAYVDRLPPPDEQPLLTTHESLHRFLLKSTAPDPADRFGSAEEMAEQLLGILREDAARRGEAHPAVSSIFGPDPLAIGGRGREHVTADWRLLPHPKVDPGDPGAAFLLSVPDDDPWAAVETLHHALTSGSIAATTEPVLRLARAQMECGQLDPARATLEGLGDVRDWRAWWHRGLLSMAAGTSTEAIDWLDPVYTDMPGEVAPKLALALAHELAGDLARSAELYDRAARSDPSYVSGAFGLARVRMLLNDRDGAVEALELVPRTSSAHGDAQVAIVRALASLDVPGGGANPPSPHHLGRASTLLEALDLDAHRRALLELALFEAALFTIARGYRETGAEMLGHRFTNRSMCLGLEATYRRLARQTSDPRERVSLIDSANRVRPRTFW